MSQIKPEQIRWRVGSTSKDKSKGMLLGYIDSRTAMELLDAQDPAWTDEYQIVSLDGSQGVQCALTVGGITRTDVGVPSNTEGLKGAYSDALKRAAVKHGIGRELYELPRIWVALDNYGRPTAEPAFVKGRWILPSGTGSVHYDHEPTDTPQQAARAAAAPAAEGRAPQPSAPAQLDDDPSAMFDDSPPADLQERIVRARSKGEAQAATECPEHGATKVKKNARGLYCATKVGDGWCEWNVAA